MDAATPVWAADINLDGLVTTDLKIKETPPLVRLDWTVKEQSLTSTPTETRTRTFAIFMADDTGRFVQVANTDGTALMWGHQLIPAVTGVLAAVRRARKTLMESLGDAHRIEYVTHNRITIVGSHTGHLYRIYLGRTGNVMRLGPGDLPTDSFCYHTPDWIPDEDTMLAQKMLLEADEQKFLKEANRSSLDLSHRLQTFIQSNFPPVPSSHASLAGTGGNGYVRVLTPMTTTGYLATM